MNMIRYRYNAHQALKNFNGHWSPCRCNCDRLAHSTYTYLALSLVIGRQNCVDI